MAEDRCLPAYTRRRSAGSGRLVRSAKSERNVEMDVLAGIERGIAVTRQYCMWNDPESEVWSDPVVPRFGTRDTERCLLESPDTFLTKMRIVSSASEPIELMLEMESERRIMMAVVELCCACVWRRMTLVWRPMVR